MTIIYANTLFAANTINSHSTQLVGNLVDRTVYFFRNLSQQSPYQIAGVVCCDSKPPFLLYHK